MELGWRLVDLKLGIHLRQKQAEAQRSNFFLASVDGAASRAASFRGCRDPSHRVSVDQSKASPRNSPLYVQYGRNVPRLAETKKHSLFRRPYHTSACLFLKCIPGLKFPVWNVPLCKVITKSKVGSLRQAQLLSVVEWRYWYATWFLFHLFCCMIVTILFGVFDFSNV